MAHDLNRQADMNTAQGGFMFVQEEHIAALRAYLRHNLAEFERLTGKGTSSSPEVHGVMFSVAFLEAVRLRFGEQCDPEELIRYVADLRRRLDRDRKDDVDPRATEQLIRGAFGEAVNFGGIDENARAHAQITVLDDLVAERRMDDTELKAFLSRVRQVTERRLTAR